MNDVNGATNKSSHLKIDRYFPRASIQIRNHSTKSKLFSISNGSQCLTLFKFYSSRIQWSSMWVRTHSSAHDFHFLFIFKSKVAWENWWMTSAHKINTYTSIMKLYKRAMHERTDYMPIFETRLPIECSSFFFFLTIFPPTQIKQFHWITFSK